MPRRASLLFGIIAVCILGINCFQAYWYYTNYQVAAEQFGRTVNESLWAALSQQQLRSGAMENFKQRYRTGQVFKDFDSTRRSNLAYQANGLRPPVPTHDTASLSTIMRQLPAFYRDVLRKRDIDAAFVLDTIDLRRPTDGYGLAVDAPPGFGLHTRPIPLFVMQPGSSWRVVAAFQPPRFYLLRRMAGALGGAVLLLALTMGCFWLMLNMIQKQKKLADIKSDFINNMTHELRTPLTTVSAAVEALQHFGALQDPQKTQHYLSLAHGELSRLSDLVDNVLLIAQEERATPAIAPTPTEPADLLRAAVARYQLSPPKPVHFEVNLAPTGPVPLDALHLAGVLNNLIDNALKYSHASVTIGLRSHRDATGWWLRVQDDGMGIPKEYQAVIFDRFFRVPTGDLHPVKGFGLGLYYVRQVAEAHGGRVAVHSRPGYGSTFTLWIPC